MTDGAFSLSPPGSFRTQRRSGVSRRGARRAGTAARSRPQLRRRAERRRRSADGKFRARRGNRNRSSQNQEPVAERRRVPGGSSHGGIVSKQEIDRSLRQIERDANSDCGNAARGIKVELRAILPRECCDCVLRSLRGSCASMQSCYGAIPPRFRFLREPAVRSINIQTRRVSLVEQPDNRTNCGAERVFGPDQR